MQTWDAIAVLPEIILTLAGIATILLGAFQKSPNERSSGAMAHLGLLGAAVGITYQWGHAGPAFGGMLLVDSFSIFFHILFLIIAALVALASSEYLTRENMPAAEYYALLLFATVGMGIMSSANDLIVIFIGLEISSLASYVLVGFRRDAPNSSEASLKYFLLGSFATAFLLYGIALLFGATASTRLPQIRVALIGGHNAFTAALSPPPSVEFPASLVALAIALIFVGLSFKVSAAPFQVWTPDVYQGAPTPVTAFLSTGPKAAAFAAFLRIFMVGLAGSSGAWTWMIWITATLSMFVGNLAALLQLNVKRMLAYSSIAHAGYMLVAFTAHSSEGVAAVIFYLAGYTFMNIGAFVVVSHFGGEGERYVEIDDYAGLGYRFPVLAACFSVFLLSLIGIPLTAGFFGKFYIFRAALRGDLVGLTVLAALNSGIAAYYYLRVLVAMYMTSPTRKVPCEPLRPAMWLALMICVAGTLFLGIFPQSVLNFVSRAAQGLQTVP